MHFCRSTNIIDGHNATSPTVSEVINPSTERIFALVPVATPEQLEEAVVAAERAFPSWSARPWEERQAALNALADLVDQYADEFVYLLMTEIGKDRGSAYVPRGYGN